ncbi:calpain-B-like [Ischnura elegans]|uniref:calpain-B-like n=1 Tax=Ischnura elegans TaxID=197161 RepID=UPI001ED8A57B|nr:calpain-B-like [Ischnura elegans]
MTQNPVHVYKLGERGSGTKIKGNIQDYEEIRNYCLSKGYLFRDQEFPADNRSLGQWGYQDWKRPSDITRDPKFVLDGTSRFDINQGELGDCWLISAIANITLHQNIVDNVVDRNQSFKEGEYAGIFHFRFWQLGKWVDVVVDDYLPTKHNRPMFLHSVGNDEFWGSLLEKAYAKLNGSYQALVGGFTYEALEDFTGGLTEVIKLSEYNASDLFHIMKKAIDRSSLMGCSIEGTGGVMEDRTSLGLITTHAYSITDVKEVTLSTGHKVQLVRVRNPWGNEAEWKGPWSDRSREWNSISQSERQSIGLTFESDGEFWISVQDFKNNFTSMDMTHLGPDGFRTSGSDGKRRWEVNEFHGQWVRGISAGGCNVATTIYCQNPQYFITVEDPDPEDGDDATKNTVIVSLMQRSRRSMGQGVDNLCIGVSVYRVENLEKQSKPLDSQFFLYNRAVNTPTYSYQRAITNRFLLTPGTYCIVPAVYQPRVEGEYLLRVFTEKYNEMKEHDEEFGEEEESYQQEEGNGETKEEIEEKIKEAFKEICGEDNEVDWKELKELLDNAFEEETKNKGISKNTCRTMVSMMDGDRSGKLGYDEFKKLMYNIQKWLDIFQKYDKDDSGKLNVDELKDALSAAGFRLSKRILYMIVHRYADRKGEISLDDFLACAIKLKGMLAIFKEKDRENKNSANFNLEEWIEVTMYS